MSDTLPGYGEPDRLAEQIDVVQVVVPLWSTAAQVRAMGLRVRRSIPDWARLYRAADGTLYWYGPWESEFLVPSKSLADVLSAVLESRYGFRTHDESSV